MSKIIPETIDIQRIWLCKSGERDPVDSYGEVSSIRDDGKALRIRFPFVPEKNSELTNIFFGVDYFVEKDKETAEMIAITAEGKCVGITEIFTQVKSLDAAVATCQGSPVRIKDLLAEEDKRAIAYNFSTHTFERTPDLKNKHITLYNAVTVYEAWVETKTELKIVSKGHNKEEVPLEKIDIHILAIEGEEKSPRYLRYEANLEYIKKGDPRRAIPQPSNSRTITLLNPRLLDNPTLVASDAAPQS